MSNTKEAVADVPIGNDDNNKIESGSDSMSKDLGSDALTWLNEGLPDGTEMEADYTFSLASQFDISCYHDILDDEAVDEDAASISATFSADLTGLTDTVPATLTMPKRRTG
ncbi:hypothetical protein BDQ17DRAFT_1339037 [Cyathus striatus]|nr:hypothetical protein BDQ17DRAFT_1339037 [Cyathus striatus]